MQTADFVGWAAFLITVIYTCVGLPIQARRNYINKSTGGISLFMMVVLFFTFSVWIVYGLVRKDWYIIGSNIPGMVCIFVILCQFWIYRPKRNTFKT